MKKYTTIYGKGVFKGIENETGKVILDICEPNLKGIEWIRIHSGDREGCFNSNEITQI